MNVLVLLMACKADPPADLVLTGGTVHLDVESSTDALAIRGGVVVATGADALELVGKETESHDLGGAHVYPGFHDAHVHLLAGSFALDRLLLLGSPSMTSMANAVADYAPEHPEEPWVVGYGWLSENIAAPDGRPISAVLPDRPALLVSNSGHEAIVNAKALEIAGIDASTPNPPGGTIGRDPDTGELTGWLAETAVSLVSPVVLEAYDDALLSAALPAQMEQFSRAGITGVSEILAVPGMPIGRPWIYRDLEDRGELPLRVTYYMPIFKLDDVATVAAERGDYDGNLVRFGGGKVWVDGSMGSAEAWLEEPYVDSTSVGSAYWTTEDLTAVVDAAEAEGMPLKLHVNGDAAIDATLDAFEAVATSRGGLTQTHVLEHCVLPDDDDIARIVALGMVVSVQPTHYVAAMFGDTADALGDRFDHAYDYERLRAGGIPLANGTDWPVWPSAQPFVVAWNGANSEAPHDLPVIDGIRAYTEGGGRAVSRPDELGRLDVGYLADFIVLGSDPLTVPLDSVPDTEIREVWVNGARVR